MRYPPSPIAASGLAHGPKADPRLATDAVQYALDRLGASRADAVLLFLSAHFASDPQPAIVAAARTAQTMAVTGCTALGVMTDEDWLLDTPAACALLINGEAAALPGQSLLGLAAPDALHDDWLTTGLPRFGGIAGDATGLGPYKVWRMGKVTEVGHCELPMPASKLLVSRALKPLSETLTVTALNGFDLSTLNGRQAAATLRRSVETLPPLHDVLLAQLDDVGQPLYSWPVLSLNPDGSATIAGRPKLGDRVAWMHRCADAAKSELSALLDQSPPAFALVFSCGSRGAALHGLEDHEWAAVRKAWPSTPFIGFYGNGQIACDADRSILLRQSVVVASFGN
ncbi:MAG: FIST C-terminal domain-containing protein [Burkholderiales bacterium]|nr:FIST C-terminal domain-containing protein [Burkholderiales bacterium]